MMKYKAILGFVLMTMLVASVVTPALSKQITANNGNTSQKITKNIDNNIAYRESIGLNSLKEILKKIDKGINNKESYHYTFEGKNGLKIETGFEYRSNWHENNWVSFDINFPDAPRIVTNARQFGTRLRIYSSCASDHDKSGFHMLIKNTFDVWVKGAWVFWIAIYPWVYEDPDTGLMIETRYTFRDKWDWGFNFGLNFPEAPRIITNARGKGSEVYRSCAANHNSSHFSIRVMDQHNDFVFTGSWVFWIAIYPWEYEDPSTNLMIETGCELREDWYKNDWVSFDLNFPAAPSIVTNAQGDYIFESFPSGHSRKGFHMTIFGSDYIWVFWIAIYPKEYPRDRAKTKGIYGEESEWATFEVKIERKSREFQQMLFYRLLEQFPLLQKMLCYIL